MKEKLAPGIQGDTKIEAVVVSNKWETILK